MMWLRLILRVVVVVVVFVAAAVVGVALGSMGVPAAHIYPTPPAPAHIVARTATPTAATLVDFALPSPVTSVVIFSEMFPPYEDSAENQASSEVGVNTAFSAESAFDSFQVVTPVAVAAAVTPPAAAVFSATIPAMPDNGTMAGDSADFPGNLTKKTTGGDGQLSGNNEVGNSAESLSFQPARVSAPVIGPAPTFTPPPPVETIPPPPVETIPPPPVETIPPPPTATIPPPPTATIPPPGVQRCAAHTEAELTMLHGHYDAANGCWHDHSHRATDEPEPSPLFLSNTGGYWISVPWATGGGLENQLWRNGGKHEGNNRIAGSFDDGNWMCRSEPIGVCLETYELFAHAIPNNLGMRVRRHSFAALLTLGDGYIFWGGHMDCGRYVTIDDVPGFDIDPGGNAQPNGTALKHTQQWNKSQTWYCRSPYLGIDNVVGTAFGRQIGKTTPDNLFGPFEATCPTPDAACLDRGQSVRAVLFVFDLASNWVGLDPDGNGIVDHHEVWVDVDGVTRDDGVCSAPAPNCIRFVIHDMPVARYFMEVIAPPNGTATTRYITDTPAYLDWWMLGEGDVKYDE